VIVRRAVILPVVLMVIILLGLLGAAFSFRIHADNAATQAVANRLQTRLAAEAGVEWVKLLLRTGRLERSVWYQNPAAFNRVILWARDEDSKVAGTNRRLDEDMAFRFSIVADDLTDDKKYIRFGLIDEASKLNLNLATEAQLTKLVTAAAVGDKLVKVDEVVNAILDWRDADSEPRSLSGGAEGEYYRRLDKPYLVKNGPFDTVEELLLVRGVTANLLYGEDFDRNGLLTDNEDDGGETFPPDNEDGLLNQGLYPYLTVLSYETNVSNANRARVSLLGDENALRSALEVAFPDEPTVVEFCVSATRPGAAVNTPPGQDNPNGTDSPSNGQPPQDGRTPAGANPSGSRNPAQGGGGPSGQGGGGGDRPVGSSLLPGVFDLPYNTDIEGDKRAALAQRRPDDPSQPPDTSGSAPGTGDAGSQDAQTETPAGTDTEDAQGDAPSDETGDPENAENEGENDDQTSDATNPSSPIRSQAYLMFPRTMVDGVVRESPVGPEHLPALVDLTTLLPPETREVVGLINVNTAPRLVLSCIEGLTSDQVDAIVSERDALDDETLATTAWLVTTGILDTETFARIASQITARAQQFRIQSIGFADHIGTVTRLEVIVDMNGPIAETIYYRDISYLGAPFPIREEDREEQNAR
jgi:type II secretory pathway component PulK